MPIEENKAIVHRFYEELNKGNVVALDELCTADFVWHAPGGLEQYGAEVTKKILARVFATFPDLRMTIEDMIAEGDKSKYKEPTRHHDPRFDIDEACLPLGVELMTSLALEYLFKNA